MQFGIVDHMDKGTTSIATCYADRLNLIQLYESLGFRAYHMAEHHGTPLSISPSPNLFLAAAAVKTTRIRLGTLVNVLPLYHPVRLIEEVCMLDHMTGGRLELGGGKGASPVELGLYGVDSDCAREQFQEMLSILVAGLTSDVLTYHGTHYDIDHVPMALRPVQQPHPPLWYGVRDPDRAAWCAEREINTVALLPSGRVRPLTDRYREQWTALGRDPDALPFMGVTRSIVIAPSAKAAMDSAKRAFKLWRESLDYLWVQAGITSTLEGVIPHDFEEWHAAGEAFAGTPDAAREFVEAQVDAAGINYMAVRAAFGDLTPEEVATTTRLFAEHVMPAFASQPIPA